MTDSLDEETLDISKDSAILYSEIFGEGEYEDGKTLALHAVNLLKSRSGRYENINSELRTELIIKIGLLSEMMDFGDNRAETVRQGFISYLLSLEKDSLSDYAPHAAIEYITIFIDSKFLKKLPKFLRDSRTGVLNLIEFES